MARGAKMTAMALMSMVASSYCFSPSLPSMSRAGAMRRNGSNVKILSRVLSTSSHACQARMQFGDFKLPEIKLPDFSSAFQPQNKPQVTR
eukprot:765885-Hanusia_phi.AAC.2